MSAWYWAGYTLSKLIGRIFFRYRVIHPERMIQTGPVILAMNHQSYLDPPLAGIACKRPIYFLARKSLLNVPILGRILPKLNVIPVDQEGMDRGALKALLRILRAGEGALGHRTVICNRRCPVLDSSSPRPVRRSCRCEFLDLTKPCRGVVVDCAFIRSRW